MELLDDMALFVEVVRAGGFGKAAARLGLATSTLSVRISRLEQRLGLLLLHRSTRRVEMTEAGRLYYERAWRIVQEARLAHEELGQMRAQPAGVLRVAAPVDLAQTALAPLLPGFMQRHPHIELHLHLSARRVDLAGEGFDVALRMGQLPDSPLVARLLARLGGGLYAAPHYLAAHGQPRTPQELAQHECLLFQTAAAAEAGRWALHRGAQQALVAVRGRVTGDNIGLIVRLAAAGLGVAALPDLLAQPEVAAGRLQKVLPQWQTPEQPLHALTATRLLPAKTRAWLDFLKASLPGALPENEARSQAEPNAPPGPG